MSPSRRSGGFWCSESGSARNPPVRRCEILSPQAEWTTIPTASPTAQSARRSDDHVKWQRAVDNLGHCGLANDFKWNRFLAVMLSEGGCFPKFRFKYVGHPPSLTWDQEWFYHLPFPLLSLEWLDLRFLEETHQGKLIAPVITDQSGYVEDLLRSIGFDYHKGSRMIRIFGYSPKNWDLFDE